MPVPSSTVVIVSGPVRILINKKWKQRFCVIAKTPPYSASMKLFVYKEASEYKKSIDLVGQSPYDIVYGLDSESAWKNERSSVRSTLILTCHERLVLLGFSSPSELKPWHDKIAMTSQDASYRAKFTKCEAGCKLQPIPDGSEGRLHVQLSRICFYTEPAEACKHLAVWELRFIKRYMVNEALKSFIFEGDIGCGKFRGMQYFACEQRQKVYADMKAACRSLPLPSLASVDAATDRRPASLVLGTSSSAATASASAAAAAYATASVTHASQLRPPLPTPSSCSIDIPQSHGSVSRRTHHHHHHHRHQHHLHHYHPQCPLLPHHQRLSQPHQRAQIFAACCEPDRSNCGCVCCLAAPAAATDADILFPFDSDEAGRQRLAQQQQQPHRDYYNLRDRTEIYPPMPVTSGAANASAAQPSSLATCCRNRAAVAAYNKDCATQAQAAASATNTGPSLVCQFTRSLSMNIRCSRADSRSRLVRSSNDLRGGSGGASCHSGAGQADASALPSTNEDAGSRQSGSHLSSAGDDCCCLCGDESSGHSPSSFGNSAGAAAPPPPATANAAASTSLFSTTSLTTTTTTTSGTLSTILEAAAAVAAAPAYIRSLSECQTSWQGHRRTGCLPPLPPLSPLPPLPPLSQPQPLPHQQQQQQLSQLERCPYINLASLSGPPTACYPSGSLYPANGGVHLHYAKLDHTATAASVASSGYATESGYTGPDDSASMLDSLLLQQSQLNYTELDHSKTRAFQEIAAEQGARRHPVGRSASAVGSGGGGGSSGGGRRSFIRIFHRSSVKSD